MLGNGLFMKPGRVWITNENQGRAGTEKTGVGNSSPKESLGRALWLGMKYGAPSLLGVALETVMPLTLKPLHSLV